MSKAGIIPPIKKERYSRSYVYKTASIEAD